MKKELRHSLNWQMCILSMSLFSHYHTPMLCAIQLVNWQKKVTVVSMHMGSPPTIHCGVSAVKINICKTPSTRWSNSQSSIIRFKFFTFQKRNPLNSLALSLSIFTLFSQISIIRDVFRRRFHAHASTRAYTNYVTSSSFQCQIPVQTTNH